MGASHEQESEFRNQKKKRNEKEKSANQQASDAAERPIKTIAALPTSNTRDRNGKTRCVKRKGCR